jgi:hypothetical protein
MPATTARPAPRRIATEPPALAVVGRDRQCEAPAGGSRSAGMPRATDETRPPRHAAREPSLPGVQPRPAPDATVSRPRRRSRRQSCSEAVPPIAGGLARRVPGGRRRRSQRPDARLVGPPARALRPRPERSWTGTSPRARIPPTEARAPQPRGEPPPPLVARMRRAPAPVPGPREARVQATTVRERRPARGAATAGRRSRPHPRRGCRDERRERRARGRPIGPCPPLPRPRRPGPRAGRAGRRDA